MSNFLEFFRPDGKVSEDNSWFKNEQKLTGLFMDTSSTIAEITARGHRALSRLPASETIDSSNHQTPRFFNKSQVQRKLELPTDLSGEKPGNKSIRTGSGAIITGIETSTFRRFHFSRKGKPTIGLPAKDKRVTVTFRHPNTDNPDSEPRHQSVSLSSKGYALNDSGPSGLESSLSATRTVADALQNTFGIDIGSKTIDSLQKRWKSDGPRATHSLPHHRPSRKTL